MDCEFAVCRGECLASGSAGERAGLLFESYCGISSSPAATDTASDYGLVLHESRSGLRCSWSPHHLGRHQVWTSNLSCRTRRAAMPAGVECK
jgi:hypothetical protein